MCIPDEDEDFDEYKLTLTLVIENDQIKEIKDISGFTHGIGWCAPQQGACKLTLNV